MTKTGFYLYSFLGILLLLLVPDLFGVLLPAFCRNFDEIAAVLALGWLLFYLVKCWKIPREFVFLPVFFVFGVLGNCVWDYQKNVGVVFLDYLIFLKPYIFLLFSLEICKFIDVNILLKKMQTISKFLVILMLVCLLINEFVVNIGTFYTSKQGERFYTFFSGFSGGVGWWSILLFTILMCPKRKNILWYPITFVIVFFTRSDLSFVGMILVPLFYLIVEKGGKIRWYYFVPVFALAAVLGFEEISRSLMNESAPRSMLYRYAFITSIACFPIGSGFGTYGSVMAAKYYSILYQNYGFQSLYGMSKDMTNFLLDSYYPMILGQFGILGCGVFFVFLYRILKKNVLTMENKTIRCWSLYLFVIFIAAGIGFATGNNWGCSVFLLIGFFRRLGEKNEKNTDISLS